MKTSVLIIILISLNQAFCQNTIDSLDWHETGVTNYYYWDNFEVISFDSIKINFDMTNCETIDHIFNNYASGKILFSEGNYVFNCQINVSNNFSIEGVCPELTTFSFTDSIADDLFRIQGEQTQITELQQEISKGSTNLVTNNLTSTVSIGDLLYLIDDDSNLITSSWSDGATGQIIQVINISNDTCYFDQKLRRNFSDPIQIHKITPANNIKLSKFKIESNIEVSSQKSNILVKNAQNILITEISSNNCNFSHINITRSKNIEVNKSQFKNGFNYGSGGKAYGTVLQSGTSDCSINNNFFDNLRHSMLLQAGANGNSISFNYSINPFWTDVSLPSNSSGDIVLHGNYPFSNLFEGNVCQNLVIDDSHGKNGPHNIFFRNRCELYGIFMNQTTPTDSTVFIGNEITNSGFLLGNYLLAGQGNVESSNNVLGNCIPSGTENLTHPSLIQDNLPLFYSNSNWPPIGYPNSINENQIETQYLVLSNSLSSCLNANTLELSNNVKIYPNPASEQITIVTDEPGIKTIGLITLNGQLVWKKETEEKEITIPLREISNGTYILKLILNNQLIEKKIIIK